MVVSRKKGEKKGMDGIGMICIRSRMGCGKSYRVSQLTQKVLICGNHYKRLGGVFLCNECLKLKALCSTNSRSVITGGDTQYKGFTIRPTKNKKGFYAYNKKTGDTKGGSSRSFIEKSIKEIKEKIDKKVSFINVLLVVMLSLANYSFIGGLI